MKDKELTEIIKSFEARLDRFSNIEERLEVCWKNVEKFRYNMINKGYSYAMVEEFTKAIQPVQQHVNEIRHMRKKLENIQKAQQERENRLKEREAERKAALIDRYTQATKMFPYNTNCRNFSFTDGNAICDVKMDLTYCNNNCPYCTNRPSSNKVDYKGRVIPKKRRK